jgi:hypothetical protein
MCGPRFAHTTADDQLHPLDAELGSYCDRSSLCAKRTFGSSKQCAHANRFGLDTYRTSAPTSHSQRHQPSRSTRNARSHYDESRHLVRVHAALPDAPSRSVDFVPPRPLVGAPLRDGCPCPPRIARRAGSVRLTPRHPQAAIRRRSRPHFSASLSHAGGATGTTPRDTFGGHIRSPGPAALGCWHRFDISRTLPL